MSSMSSAQIVSATAMHNKATAAAAGLTLGLGNPVPYTGAVTAVSLHFTQSNTIRLLYRYLDSLRVNWLCEKI